MTESAYYESETANGATFDPLGDWRSLIAKARSTMKRTGYELVPFWEAYDVDDYDKAAKILQEMERYSRRQARYYRRY